MDTREKEEEMATDLGLTGAEVARIQTLQGGQLGICYSQ